MRLSLSARFLPGLLAVSVALHSQSNSPVAGVKTKFSSTKTQIVLLGTGTPGADPDRSGPSVAIVVNNTPYLVDFGPGVIRRAAAAYKAGIKALAARNLRRAFVTHLHSDHTAGYPDLIFTPWVAGRSEALEVYGPAGLVEMTGHILKAYQRDIEVRTEGLQGANTTGYKVIAHEIQPGTIYKDENVIVKAFPVKHGSWDQAFGYRFETADRSIVISGDTTRSQSIVENCMGCDVLIHEVYPDKNFDRLSPLRQKYHANFHTSAKDLAELAQEAQPGILILYHQLLGWAPEEEILAEIRAGYKGKVVSGHDLEVY